LSPEDLVNFALQTDSMKIVGVYGVGTSRARFITGEKAEKLVKATISDALVQDDEGDLSSRA